MSETLQYLLGGGIGGGIIGGLIGAAITHFATARRERQERERERDGLLRLIYMEILFNEALVLADYLHEGRKDYFHAANPGRPLYADAWKQARFRIAQLIPAYRFTSLVEYYVNVQAFNNLLDEHTSPDIRTRDLPGQADSIANQLGPEVRTWMRDEYIGPMTPLPGVPE